MKTVAIIAARKGSSRIPGKVSQLINGETMLMRKVRQVTYLLGDCVTNVVVAGDTEEFKDEIALYGAHFYRQPDDLCEGRPDRVNEFLKDILEKVADIDNFDQVLWAHPTNPFIDTSDYQDALNTLEMERDNGYDSLFSVNELKGHFWNHLPSPINFAPLKPRHIIAGDLNPVYNQNGGIFIRPYKDMVQDGKFVSNRAFMYSMDEVKGWDIDYPWQIEFAQQRAEAYNL